MIELEEMLAHYGDEYIDKNLSVRTKELITLAVMTATCAYPQLKEQAATAIKNGLAPGEITEAIIHCAPYCGYTKGINALKAVEEAFKELNVEMPASQARVTEANRYEKGLEVQRSIFGPQIGTITEDMPEDERVITRYLSGICFGDFYTRDTLDLRDREIITLTVIAANGGCEPQLKGHTLGNLSVGNTPDMLLAAILHCVPHNGYPRTLNALNAIKTALPKE